MQIIFAGDISLSRLEDLSFGEKMEDLFNQADIIIGNLESPISYNDKKKRIKSYHLKANCNLSSNLKKFNALSLANNHIIDYQNSIVDTRDELQKVGIHSFGAGFSLKEAMIPYTIECKDIKVAIFWVSNFYNIKRFRRLGTASINSRKLLKSIREFKQKGYLIIVYPHWGYEYIPFPSPRERKLAKRLICYGADMIIGNHAHEIQAMEYIQGKPIFYGLGNFVFSESDFTIKDDKIKTSIIISINITDNRIEDLQIIPCIFEDNIIDIMPPETREKILKYLFEISSNFNIPLNKYRKLFYEEYANIRENRIS